MPSSRPTKTESSLKLERLSKRLAALESNVSDLPDKPAPSQAMLIDVARIRSSLMRARNAFKRLGNGSLALSGFTLVAFLAALFDSKLSLLSGFITMTAALFLALVGYIFHMQADSIDLGDTND
jgi:hypothetical protein